MSEPFLGQIAITAFSFAPRRWAFCNGALLSAEQSIALFSLLGYQFGGDGKKTFALPDLRGRIAVGAGTSKIDRNVSFKIGESAGSETVVLTTANMPAHNHVVCANTVASTVNPQDNLWGGDTTATFAMYGIPSTTTNPPNPPVAMNAAAIGTAGENQGHENMPPFIVANYIICLDGYYPQRS